ncbi:MAG TPA: hypothetical protein VF826_17500 [Chloroflexia bacterium]
MPRVEDEAVASEGVEGTQGKPAKPDAPSTGVDLPWLQAVQQHSVQETSDLRRTPPPGQAPAQQPAQPAQPPTGPELQPPTEQEIAAQPPGAEQMPPNVRQMPVREATQPPADPNEPPPDWVVSILEPTVTPPPPQQEYEPEELAHIMPWAHPDPDQGASGPPNPAAGTQLPPWLREVTVQETLEAATPATPQEPAAPPVYEDFALEGIEPFLPPPLAEDEPAQPVAPVPQEQVPAWLRSVSSGKDEQAALDADATVPDYAAQLEAMPASEGGFRNIPVRAPRAGAVDTLATLLQAETLNVPRRVPTGQTGPLVQARPASRRGFSRWLLPDGLIYLLILGVLLAILLVRPPFGDIPFAPSTDVTQFYNAIESVPDNAPVLVVYDWDATRSAEMSVLSQAVMRHLMSRRLPFVTISTAPQGPGFAQQVVRNALVDPAANYGYTYGTDYLILGYIPGNEAALRSAVDDFTAVLPLDYQQIQRLDSYPIMQQGNLRGARDFALVIDLASDEAELRNWIEQVGARTDVPLIAAVPQSLDPIARSYNRVRGTGLLAVVSGTGGALQYNRQLLQAGRNTGLMNLDELTDRLNAQSVAQLLVALVIVAAFINMATRRIFRR